MAKTTLKTNQPGVDPVGEITGGVDTHKDFHVVAAKDALGRTLDTATFPATPTGYAALTDWLVSFGPVTAVGVEGTGAYGAGLTTHLRQQQILVKEVNRPNRANRRRTGKSDPIDAIAAAAAVQAGDATATPKPRTGPVESVRVLVQTRDLLTKARTATINTLHAMIVTAPAATRESLQQLSTPALITHCASLPTATLPAPGQRGTSRTRTLHDLTEALLDPATATGVVLGELARTITSYDTRLHALTTMLHALVTRIAPATSALFGVGPGRAARLLLTASDDPARLHSEAAFARLTGVAPLDCSSGHTQDRHRLSRAGDRHANSVLYYIALTRLAHHNPTRTYLATRLNTNHSNKKHLIRCLKRYLAREIYPHLKTDLTHLAQLQHTT